MSINNVLNTGLSALLSNQAALRVTSNNIANVNTEGYVRQDARMERTQNTEAIATALKSFMEPLNARQRAIFAGRIMHDLLGREQRCAKTFGVSKQRVGQIEKQLREKLASHFTRSFGADGVKAMLRASF